MYIYACIFKFYVRVTELFLTIISITPLLALRIPFLIDGRSEIQLSLVYIQITHWIFIFITDLAFNTPMLCSAPLPWSHSKIHSAVQVLLSLSSRM